MSASRMMIIDKFLARVNNCEATISKLRSAQAKHQLEIQNLDLRIKNIGADFQGTSHGKCPVCMDNYEEVRSRNADNCMMSAVCGHLVCDRCLNRLLVTKCSCGSCGNSFGTCPTCRNEIDRLHSHPIYL